MTDTRHLLFAGTHGYVAAIDQRDGRELWRTSLPRTGYSVVSIILEDGQLLCASGGHVFALDPATGEILWRNEMPSLGHGHVYLATERSTQGGLSAVIAAQSSSDAAAASST